MFPIGCFIKVNTKIDLHNKNMENIKQKVGERIRFLRNDKNISQEELANSAGMARGFISGVETGKRNITVETLGKILVVLDLSYSKFFEHQSFN
jgi:transcriptional regulator with XRE-family HTH domain